MSKYALEEYCYYHSPIGLIKICETKGFVTSTHFVEVIPESEYPQTKNSNDSSSLLKDTCNQLEEYFEGKRQNFELAIKPNGTEFQLSTWESLLLIPYGETRSYVQQAESISNPKAIRAIGQANSKNPISIIIPCHRVIGKNGSMTGYSGGLERKKLLLAMENRFMHGQNYWNAFRDQL